MSLRTINERIAKVENCVELWRVSGAHYFLFSNLHPENRLIDRNKPPFNGQSVLSECVDYVEGFGEMKFIKFENDVGIQKFQPSNFIIGTKHVWDWMPIYYATFTNELPDGKWISKGISFGKRIRKRYGLLSQHKSNLLKNSI